ncbi:alpha/beta fold hydrolase [Pseudohalocynthiibacter aestuariivivens]|nr:alpha/beta fold hydrolase [Pseudohalocynthiibacter aestuariivivens]QIE44268.1 alpha/beta fold hydrolase [Pseudohalocynthiibacter aestuariivivens]
MAQTTDGTYFVRRGDQDAPSVILVHGLGLCAQVWQWQSPALAERYDVIAYDLYGHGDSASPPSEPSLSLFSEQLAGVMDACAIDSAAIIGFSLGGMIARRFAQDHPDRTSALAILHSPHQRTPDAQTAILARVEQARRDGPAATVEAALERWFTDTYRQDHPDMMDLVRRWVRANDIAIYHRNYRVLADGIDEITAPEPPINIPTLVVTGDEDYGNGPEMTRAIAAEIPGAETHILPGLRHMALAEDPDQMNNVLLGFLDRNLKGPVT